MPIVTVLPKPNGFADREHHVAHLQRVVAAERDRGQRGRVGLQHREIGLGIGAADACRELAPVVEHELDLVGAFDDMVVGQHVAVGRDDDAGAPCCAAPRLRMLADSGK
jgi:hypothetical protein